MFRWSTLSVEGSGDVLSGVVSLTVSIFVWLAEDFVLCWKYPLGRFVYSIHKSERESSKRES